MRSYGLLAIALVLTTGACDDTMTFEPSATTYTQLDFMGRPAIATVFLGSSEKDPYNRSVPSEQRAMFGGSVEGFLMNVAGYSAADATALANVLLPDILTVDLDAPSAYLNGRAPADDVTTGSLMLVFGAGTPLSDDNVDNNDKAYPTTFPFIATPHLQ